MYQKCFASIFYLFFFMNISVLQTSSSKQVIYWENLTDYMKIWAKNFNIKNRPIFEELLKSSTNISQSCSQSVFSTFDAIEKLESWSIELINSWGNFPPAGNYSLKQNFYFKSKFCVIF